LASTYLWITAGLLTFFLFSEFFTLIFGVSVMFRQVNVIQIVLHGMGVLSLIWMILDRWGYLQLGVIGVFTVFIPLLLELSVIFAAH
jgi:hypothetical protein